MAKNTYHTFTEDTPIDTYRSDFLRRSAMCTALVKRYPAFAGIASQAGATVAQIDTRQSELRAVEDDLIRARALEDVEKLDVIDMYTELRRTMTAKSYDVLTLLPDSPSSLRRIGTATFSERVQLAIASLKELSDDDEIKKAFLASLEKELADFQTADKAEDTTRAAVQGKRVALTLYKAELAQAREAELGTIQNVLRDRDKTSLFTVPWRKSRRLGEPDAEPEQTAGTPPPES